MGVHAIQLLVSVGLIGLGLLAFQWFQLDRLSICYLIFTYVRFVFLLSMSSGLIWIYKKSMRIRLQNSLE